MLTMGTTNFKSLNCEELRCTFSLCKHDTLTIFVLNNSSHGGPVTGEKETPRKQHLTQTQRELNRTANCTLNALSIANIKTL